MNGNLGLVDGNLGPVDGNSGALKKKQVSATIGKLLFSPTWPSVPGRS